MNVAEAIPATFDAARSSLEPRLVGLTASAITRLELRNAGEEFGAGVFVPVSSDLGVGAVIATDDGGVLVSAAILEKWAVPVETVVAAAVENTFGRDIRNAGQVGDATFVIEDEQFAAAALFNPAMLAGFAVLGEPVVFTPSTGLLIVTGSNDEQGLIAAVTLAEAAVSRGDKLVSATPFQLTGGRWSEYSWPASAAVEAVARLLVRRWSSTLYAWQAPALTAALAAAGRDVVVAEAVAAKSPTDGVITYSTLTEGTVTALPITDLILIVKLNGDVAQTSWQRLFELLESQTESLDVVPARYVVAFPSDEQLAQLVA